MATAPELTTSDPPGPARKLRRGPLTRKQILDAALRLFSERGFARTSVRDIGQAAGITDAAIYYHFASKRDLFEALIEERGFTAALEELERDEVTIALPEALALSAVAALEFIYANRDLLKVLMVEALAEDAVAAEEYRMLRERWQRGQARIFRIFAERGELHSDAIDDLAKQFVLTVLGVISDYMMMPKSVPAPDAPPAELFRHLDVAVRHLVRGIA